MLEKIAGDLRRAMHMLSPEQAAMVREPGFGAALLFASQDDDTKAFLMIEALKGIALDSRTGDTLGAFVTVSNDVAAFNIQFHGWTNFIGWIELPADAGRARQLIAAIEANLGSRMFKAARIHRRLNSRRTRLYEQARGWASAAYARILVECGGRFSSQEEHDRACAVRNEIVDRRLGAINARVRKVADAATPSFNGAYSERVAEFLYRHLPFGTLHA